MALDTRTAQTTLENLLRDTILYALGWRLPQQANAAALRAFTTMGASGEPLRGDCDLITVAGSPVLSYRWNQTSTATDDGVTVIKPDDVGAGNGRWVQWTSPLRFATVVGAPTTTLDQITSGPLRRVLILDRPTEKDDLTNLLFGVVPAVVIETDGDDPKDMTFPAGLYWDTAYEFTISVLTENLRGGRQAQQGSDVAGEDPGANAIDGFIKALLAGTALTAVVDDIRCVQIGNGHNWVSDLGQRRVIRSRKYRLLVTEKNPAAPGDSVDPTDVFIQPNMVSTPPAPVPPAAQPPLAVTPLNYDPNNYLIAGCRPTLLGGLANNLSAGSAKIAGSTVTYAGQSVTFPAWSDTYRDLAPNGTMTLTSVTAGGFPPAVAAGAMRIGVTTTNGTQVVGDAVLAETQAAYGPAFDVQI